MIHQPDPDWDVATLGVRAAEFHSSEAEHSLPIYATSSFIYRSAAEAAARFAGESPGNIYSRFTNPTVRAFEQRLAAMEGGECCVATASGMSAVLSVCMALLQSGDHIVAARGLFGSTTGLLRKHLSRFGVQTTFVPIDSLDAWEGAIQPNTRMLFVETPTNPLTEIADIAALADLAHRHDALLVVDNCFCTPVLQRPLALGADVVVHSATKFLDGQGRCVGGAVVGDRKRVGESVFAFARSAGPCMSPFNAWVFLKGLETLELRMSAHCERALALARWLAEQPAIERVYYPGLPTHPQHSLAVRQQRGFGGIVSFDVRGGREAAWRVIDATRMITITGNLGDTRTTVTHAATTTHSGLTPEERAEAGIGEGFIRMAVGLEAVDDIIADLSRGLAMPEALASS